MPRTRTDGRHYIVPVNCEKVSSRQTVSIERFSFTASCNNLSMVRFLVESGACLFASTLSDHETPAEKCEEDEEGFDGCSEYLYSKFALNSSHDRIITQSVFIPRRYSGEAWHTSQWRGVCRLLVRCSATRRA